MSLITSGELLLDAREHHYAVGAFNIENMEMVMTVLSAAEETGTPVIMQTTPGTIKFAGLDYYSALVHTAAARSRVPIVLHLDHGNSFELCARALNEGYSSIMIDGSKLPFEDNITLTESVVRFCHACDIPVEGELGKVGGKEDDLVNSDDVPYTDPDEAEEFIRRTGVDSLAIGIGTSHGVYKSTPKLNIPLIGEIAKRVDIPLVMHGTSGISDDQVRECVKQGICKVNYATDLRIAFMDGVKAHAAAHSEDYDPKKYAKDGMDNVRNYVVQKTNMLQG